MGEFVRDRLPSDIEGYYDSRGISWAGPGKTWRTANCVFHGGSDSMRINLKTGAFVCMNCGEKGGDVLAYEMASTGSDFVTAARNLGAYVDDDKEHRGESKPRLLSARAALEVLRHESLVILLALQSIDQDGSPPSYEDWARVKVAMHRIEMIASEVLA